MTDFQPPVAPRVGVCAECGRPLRRYTNQTVEVHANIPAGEKWCELDGQVWLLGSDPDGDDDD